MINHSIRRQRFSEEILLKIQLPIFYKKHTLNIRTDGLKKKMEITYTIERLLKRN